MKNLTRKYFDQEQVQSALSGYKSAWNSVLDDAKGYQMLERHGASLDDRLAELKDRHYRLFKQFRNNADEAARSVAETAMNHADSDIVILEKVKQNIAKGGGNILTQLQSEAGSVLDTLNKGDEAILDENGNIRSEFIKKLYAKSRPETWERYAVMDAIYEKGEEFAIDHSDSKDRAFHLALIPSEIRRAKWKFMLATADAAYSIDIGHIAGESIGPNHLELLSNLYARLSDRERGSENPHMPETHKYRHNPAIHSLHTLALADKIFHEVRWDIDHNMRDVNGSKKAYLDKLDKMRARIFLAALVHDMGEMDGELSQGIKVAHMSDPLMKLKLEQARNEREESTFLHHLDEQKQNLHHVQNGKITGEPIGDKEWEEIRQSYVSAFKLAEKTDTFLGRFFKTLERMQSQQDYLRFEGMSGALPLRHSDEANKTFSCNYVSRVLRDANWESNYVGPSALTKLAEKGRDETGVALQRMLVAATENEYLHLMERNIESYYGKDSPEMLRLEAVKQRRAPSLSKAS